MVASCWASWKAHSSADTGDILLTGVTGFIGKVVLESLLHRRVERGIGRVFVLIRPTADLTAQERFEREVVAAKCFSRLTPSWRTHVTVISGDITAPNCGVSDLDRTALAGSVTRVLHAAASVEFNLPLDTALAINTFGTRNVLELARELPRLRRLTVVSTAYVTPHGDAPIPEALPTLPRPADEIVADITSGRLDHARALRSTGHPNTYTLTKALAEHHLADHADDLDIAIVRPSVVSAAWRAPMPGWIDSTAAFAGFVALVGGGYVRAFPADPGSKIDIVPVDIVAELLIRTAFDNAGGPGVTIRHAVAGPDHSPTTGECRDHVVTYFRRHPVGRRPGVPYYGPTGARYRSAHLLLHHVGIPASALLSGRGWRAGRRLLRRIRAFNRLFPYFTHHAFAFISSDVRRDVRPEPGMYLDLICRGVHEHLLGGDLTRTPLTPRATFDLPSFERARKAWSGGTVPPVIVLAGDPLVGPQLISTIVARYPELDLAQFTVASRSSVEGAVRELADAGVLIALPISIEPIPAAAGDDRPATHVVAGAPVELRRGDDVPGSMFELRPTLES